ncbi:MAG: NAD(P)H-hydrate dehydratase [Chloroflexota bacterium]|nr:NAD(P)H-hydrate dehydratase [Chloroflexota bacterium]
MNIVSVAQMRALEAAAVAAGTSEAALQQRAGRAVAEEVFRLLRPDERVVVLVGHGNNGRDGAVAAEWLGRHGVPVDVVLTPRHGISLDELASLRAGGAVLISNEDHSGVERALGGARVALDALAGIGTRGALREPLASVAARVNEARTARGNSLQVVALDIPSGTDAESGEVSGAAVSADCTVTLGGVKQGLLRFPAAACVGKLVARDIGIPESAGTDQPYGVLGAPELGRLVPPRPLSAHKYRFGRLLVVAGTDHFPGAAVLCSGAAARVGAGLVTLASSREVRLNTAVHLPEVTYTENDVVCADGAAAALLLATRLAAASSVVVGPGLGRGPGTTAFVHAILTQRKPEQRLVLDADALFALAHIEGWPRLLGSNAVLTPHSGELEHLVGSELDPAEPAWIQAGRLAREWGCVLIAKGPFTCIAAPDGRVDVWPHANPALATGGTGDVLAGICGGLLAQGLTAWDGARLAVGAHGLAAEGVLQRRRWRTLLASDLLHELPATLQTLWAASRRR